MGGRGIRGFKVRVEWECCISSGGQIKQWRYSSWRSPRRKSQYWKVWDLQKKQGRSGGTAPGVITAKSSEFRGE